MTNETVANVPAAASAQAPADRPARSSAAAPDENSTFTTAGPPTADAARPAGQPANDQEPAAAGGTLVSTLAGLALAWLTAMLWVAHASVSSDVGAVALATAASSLPSVVSAALVAGAAAGLLVAVLSGGTDRRREGSAPAKAGPAVARFRGSASARFSAAVVTGALTGIAAGTAFVLGSGSDPARMAVAGTLAAGATLGGSLAGLRNTRVVAAIIGAGLAMFVTGFVFGLAKGPVQDFYGADGGEAARLSAAGWFAATAAVAGGLAAGVTAYRLLGGTRRQPGLRWPVYLMAGAGPGALLLVTELIVRTGGAKLLGLVREISDADRVYQLWAGGSRVNNALVVLFVGAIVALLALGRTLGSVSPRTDENHDGADAPADRANTPDRHHDALWATGSAGGDTEHRPERDNAERPSIRLASPDPAADVSRTG